MELEYLRFYVKIQIKKNFFAIEKHACQSSQLVDCLLYDSNTYLNRIIN